jgi:hypothetical protein
MRAAAVAVLLAAAPVRADVVALPKTKATLTVPAGWTRSDAGGVVAGFRAPGGVIAAVTRAQVPNPDAWRAKTREAYADQIERGVVAAARGKRTLRKLSELGSGVPALDLELKRDGGALVVVRVLLFRTYALALAIELPAGVDPRDARGVATQFAPPPEPKPPP